MAYAIIHFLEGTEPRAAVCRLTDGQPAGDGGVMDALGAFINEYSPTVMREGSPGASRMAMLWVAREQDAGREVRVVGAPGPLGIGADEIERLEGQGYAYEVGFGAPGERTLPTARARPVRPR